MHVCEVARRRAGVKQVLTTGGVDEGDHYGTGILKMNSFQFTEVEIFQISEP